MFEWCVDMCGSKQGYGQKHMFKKYMITCSKHNKYCKFNNQHNRGDLYEEFIHITSKNHEGNGYNFDLGLLTIAR